jgi:hypothetical protein
MDNREILRFLFDKRLDLFNVRREHEWKILFSVMTAIGLIDVAIITKEVKLTGAILVGWITVIIFLLVASIAYLLGVQKRNRIDRIIMDDINKKLCSEINIQDCSLMRICIDGDTEGDTSVDKRKWYSWTFLWAFYCQALVLLLVCVISCFLPISIS